MIKEEVNGEFYEITAEKYMDLMKLASYNGKGLSKIKMFKGLPLKIIGNVQLSGQKDLKNLGNVGIITGDLDIRNTNITSIKGTTVLGRVSDYGSGIWRIEQKRILNRKLAEMDSQREDGGREINSDNFEDMESGEKYEILRVNALYEFLNSNNSGVDVNFKDEDLLDEINVIKKQLEQLLNDLEKEEDDEISDVLEDRIDELQTDLEELEGDTFDIYDIYETNYRTYSIPTYEILNASNEGSWAVADEDEMESASLEQIEQFLDENGIEGLNSGFYESYLDYESIRDDMRTYYYDDISYSPESYFEEDDYTLTDEQEERKTTIEDRIDVLKSEQDELDVEDEEEEWDELEEEIDQLQEELDDISPDVGDPTEDMIDEKVDSIVNGEDEVEWLTDHGYEIRDYVDMDDLKQGMYDSDGYEGILTYDGNYDVVTMEYPSGDEDSVDFYIFRVD
jgi:DNA-binding transcriptional MerR regulator